MATKKKTPAKKSAPKKAAKKPVMKAKAAKKPAVKAKASSKKPAIAKAAKVPAKKSAPAAKPKLSAVPHKTSFSNWLSPLEDRIVVSVAAAAETTAGGIIIPGSVNERPSRGAVVAKGPGRRNKKGALRPLDVNVGDEVLFAEYAGTKITMESQDFLILREEDLLGIVT